MDKEKLGKLPCESQASLRGFRARSGCDNAEPWATFVCVDLIILIQLVSFRAVSYSHFVPHCVLIWLHDVACLRWANVSRSVAATRFGSVAVGCSPSALHCGFNPLRPLLLCLCSF